VQRPLAERLPRQHRKAAWVAAVAAPLLLTVVARLVGSAVPPATTQFVALLTVVGVALIGGVGPALVAVVTAVAAQETLFSFPYGNLVNHRPAQVSILVVFVLAGVGVGAVVDELVRLTAQQTALRRIAILVGRGTNPREVFAAVADEVAQLLGAEIALISQLGSDGLLTIVAVAGVRSRAIVGERWEAREPMAVAAVLRTGRPARTDDYSYAGAPLDEEVRRLGIRSSVATPIVVEGRLWGTVVAASRTKLPRETERRMLDFTELVATAIANSESRTELSASRARIVAASDAARRRVERDLHDGVQQRLVSLALDVRAVEAVVPEQEDRVRSELARVVEGLQRALDELREISRGIHPAILSEGGLGPALRVLARRASIPVVLDVQVAGRAPEHVEVAAYYVVSELVTNAAKHSGAPSVDVRLRTDGDVLRIVVSDDGVGGADASSGSGLIGLRDRVEALGGTMSVHSPGGGGTTVELALPADSG
jgi:signal transduction histidine kinase